MSRLAICLLTALLVGCDAKAPQVRPAPPRTAPAPSLPAIALMPPPAVSVASANLFGATTWQVAPTPPLAPSPTPAPAPAPEAVAPPAAPALPFRFLGRYGDADSQIVMLMKGDQLYLAAAGDTIEDLYRIEQVSAQMVVLTYLPLKLTQSLSTGDAG